MNKDKNEIICGPIVDNIKLNALIKSRILYRYFAICNNYMRMKSRGEYIVVSSSQK